MKAWQLKIFEKSMYRRIVTENAKRRLGYYSGVINTKAWKTLPEASVLVIYKKQWSNFVKAR